MKLLVAAAAVLAGVVVARTRSARPESDLWHEATDPARPAGAPPTGT